MVSMYLKYRDVLSSEILKYVLLRRLHDNDSGFERYAYTSR